MPTTIASLMAVIGADLTGLNNGLRTAEGKLSSFQGTMQGIGSRLMGTGTVMTAAVTAPIVAMGVGMATAAGDFEAATNILGVAARNTGTSMDDLRQAAILVGKDTQLVGIDAMEAADAMTTFYKAGMTTTDIFGDLNTYLETGSDLTGALRASIDLAAASDLDLASASNAVAIAMATFGLEADDAVDIANSFVAAADSSISEVSDLAAALTNIGPTAAQMGISLGDVNAALAVLSENGIAGAEAGTALKSMLTNMQRDTPDVAEAWASLGTSMYDAEGNMRDLDSVMADISAGLKGMTEQQRNLTIQQLAGTYGMKAMSAIIGQGDHAIEDMAMTMEDAATAQAVASERTKGFAAAMEQLQGAIQTFMITAGTPLIENVITPLIQKITEFAEKLIELDPKFITIGLAIAGVAAAIGPLLLILGGLATLIGALASPIGLIVLGVTALGAAFVAANGGIGPTIDRLREIGTTISNAVMPILDGLRAFWEWLWPYISQLFKYIWRDLEAFFGPLIADMAAFFELTFGYIKAWVDTNMPLIRETIVTILEAIQKVWDTVWPYLSDALRAVWEIMKGNVRLALTWVLGFIKATMQAINGDWEGAWETVQETVGTAIDIVKSTIANALAAVKGTFGQWAQAGRDMIMGFVGGIRDKAGEVLNSVVSAIKSAYEAATSFLRTGSPSKLFEDIGINTMQGFAKGIEATRNVPAVAARNAAGGVSRSATVTYNSAPIINSQAAMLQLLAMTRAQSITQTAMKAV